MEDSWLHIESSTLYLVKQYIKNSISVLRSELSLTNDEEKKKHYSELIDKLLEVLELV